MPPAADPGLVDKLVVANRILYRQGVVDGFGHVSVRHDASPEQAVYRACYAEVNARLQIQAMGLGEVTYLNAQEAAKAAAINDTQLARVWELWRQEIGTID